MLLPSDAAGGMGWEVRRRDVRVLTDQGLLAIKVNNRSLIVMTFPDSKDYLGALCCASALWRCSEIRRIAHLARQPLASRLRRRSVRLRGTGALRILTLFQDGVAGVRDLLLVINQAIDDPATTRLDSLAE